MDLSLHRPEQVLYVRRVGATCITVVDRDLQQSFLLCATRCIERWPVRSVAELQPEHLQALLELDPEVVLLGTGAQQVFPPARVLAPLLARGIGIEVMHNAACARTYTVMLDEGRRVAAAFILPG